MFEIDMILDSHKAVACTHQTLRNREMMFQAVQCAIESKSGEDFI